MDRALWLELQGKYEQLKEQWFPDNIFKKKFTGSAEFLEIIVFGTLRQLEKVRELSPNSCQIFQKNK